MLEEKGSGPCLLGHARLFPWQPLSFSRAGVVLISTSTLVSHDPDVSFTVSISRGSMHE
jgi:hypothetical protein